MSVIVTVTLNPAVDKAVIVPHFTVDRVNRVTQMRLDPGGKGINVSKILSALGSDSLATGFLGGDTGAYIKKALDDLRIRHDFLEVPYPTRTNLKVYDPENRSYTDINEPGAELSALWADRLFEKLLSSTAPGDIVVFAGGAPKGIEDDIAATWALKLKERGVKTAADLDGSRLAGILKSKPMFIKPNEFELKELLSLPDMEINTLKEAALQLVRGGIELVCVSMGARGALFADEKGVLMAKARARQVVSTVGAGDSVTAAIVYAKENALSREDTAALACACATAKVACEGSLAPSLSEIQEVLSRVELSVV